MRWNEVFLCRILTIVLAVALVTVLAGRASVIAAQAETGKKRCTDTIDNDSDGLVDGADPDCNEGGGANGGGGGSEDPSAVTLRVMVDFDGATSTIGPFDAVVECGVDFCEYHALPPLGDSFNLPASFADIINATSFRRTPLDAELCYDVDKTDSSISLGMINLSHISMRVYHDPSLYWDLSVNGWACDMDSDSTACDVRQYEQRFRGGCYPSGCERIDDFVAVGDTREYYGSYLNTWSSGPDQKLGIPCRCTMSNDPGCPDGLIDEGIITSLPAVEVTVTLDAFAP